MVLDYKLAPKKNPSKPKEPAKYYAQIVYKGKVDLKELSEKIARTTTMGVADINGVLIALGEELADAIQAGNYVELGNLCTFYPTIKSEGVASEGEFNAVKHIKTKGINVRAKKSIIEKMSKVEVRRV